MHEALARLIAKYECQRLEDTVRALREIIQEIALLGLWRSKFFENAAFYGGTAMRVLYGLDRFSEDLDFSLLKPMRQFDISKYLAALQKELEAFGLLFAHGASRKRAEDNHPGRVEKIADPMPPESSKVQRIRGLPPL